MEATQDASWENYFQGLYANPKAWIDYSNEQVQLQTFGFAIESAGPIIGKRCLDVGCGRGQLAACLSTFGAGEVVGIDLAANTIQTCRERYPHLRWEAGSLEDEAFSASLGEFDAVFMLEVLQYLPLKETFQRLWNRLRPGGRIVAILPNKENAIVQKTTARFEGSYIPKSPSDLNAAMAPLPDVECWAFRGMDFQQDQRLVPYAISPWTKAEEWPSPPNRLVFAALKKAA